MLEGGEEVRAFLVEGVEGEGDGGWEGVVVGGSEVRVRGPWRWKSWKGVLSWRWSYFRWLAAAWGSVG